jgi:hypothetical protein
MRATAFAFFVSVTVLLTCETGICEKAESKLVTRIEDATVAKKGRKFAIHVSGMVAMSPSLVPRGGQLVRRGDQLNKDGLLEYELRCRQPGNYSGNKLTPVKASLTESSVPVEAKGVRIFAEYNHWDAMLPPPKEKKAKEKK